MKICHESAYLFTSISHTQHQSLMPGFSKRRNPFCLCDLVLEHCLVFSHSKACEHTIAEQSKL